MTPMHILFLLTAIVTMASAVMVVSARRMMHAALWLVLTLLGVAVSFALLETRFFVVAQVIVYIGAIAILIIFAVMLTRRATQDQSAVWNRSWVFAAVIAVIFLAVSILVLSGWDQFTANTRTVPAGGEDLTALGKAFVDPQGYLIPFEVASVLLLAALIGSVFIAMEKKGGNR